MQTKPMTRGYAITRTVEFIKSGYFKPDAVNRILESLPGDMRDALPNLKTSEWYPREYMVPLMRGIASVKNDNVGSAEDLANYGQAVASEATNTFLKILMKLLTPTLFAKKFPEFYARDHKGSGHFEVDIEKVKDGKITIKLVGAEGFDHIGAASVGFFRFGIESISGPGSVDIKTRGWSLATPSPHEVFYDVTLK